MDYQCFCGESFTERDQLVQHNVDEHNMSMAESMRQVNEKYPLPGP